MLTADNAVVKRDKKGNALALDLIKGTDKKDDWKVEVAGSVSGDTIAVASLRLK